MEIRGVRIEDEFAEAFRMWACRLVVTACDSRWAWTAAQEVCGYGTSVIGCDAEAGVERELEADQTPDGRPGVSILFFAFNAEALSRAAPNRVGQCVMTCPTTAAFDGMPEAKPKAEDDTTDRLALGSGLRFFGDGFQQSKVLRDDATERDRRYWRVPVMDGEFVVEETIGACKAIGGGNLLITGRAQASTLAATSRAVEAIAPRPEVITPFPGGVVRSGSKVGSKYEALFASTNDAYCPTLRRRTRSAGGTRLREEAGCCYEIVINGLNESAVSGAMRAGIEAAAGEGCVAISAGNYGGGLGKFKFRLHEVMA